MRGYPYFIQGDDTPVCGTCKREMLFVAQLDEMGRFDFGGGVAYVFVCSEEHDARLLRQQ